MPLLKFDFTKNVDNYIATMLSLSNHRSKAYDICHEEFKKALLSGVCNCEYLSLHLFSYLASWGMVCRKSILLKQNFKYLIPAVRVVTNKKYLSLLDVDVFSRSFNNANYVKLMIELRNELASAVYGKKYESRHNTLLSKIVLVSLGCIVAYDRKVKSNLKLLKCCISYTKNGLLDLLNFATIYKTDIRTLQKKYKSLNYSSMKICDCALCF